MNKFKCEKCNSTMSVPGPPLSETWLEMINTDLDNRLRMDDGTSLIDHRSKCGTGTFKVKVEP